MNTLRVLAFVCISVKLHAQIVKPIIDSAAIQSWPRAVASIIEISPKAKYIRYLEPDAATGKQIYKLKSLSTNWQRSFDENVSLSITADEKTAVVIKNDSVCLLNLNTKKEQWLTGIESSILMNISKEGWLVYKFKGKNDLQARSLSTGKEQIANNITRYSQSDDKIIIIQQDSAKPNWSSCQLWDLQTNIKRTLLNGKDIGWYVYDKHRGGQCVFAKKDSGDNVQLFYSRSDMKELKPLRCLLEEREDLKLDNRQMFFFSPDGNKIYYTLKRDKEPITSAEDKVKVNIWSYTDQELQTQQDKTEPDRSYLAALSLDGGAPILLETDSTVLNTASLRRIDSNNWALGYAKKAKGSLADGFWWQKAAGGQSFYLQSLKDGSMKTIVDKSFHSILLRPNNVSPAEKFLVYYDPVQKNYLSYEMASGLTHNITTGINADWEEETNNPVAYPYQVASVGIAGWLPEDKALLVYDQFDIWQLDPLGNQPPINITNSFGKKYAIRFKVLENQFNEKKTVFGSNANIIFQTFDTKTKQSGFYSKKLGTQGDPQLLSQGPYHYKNITKAKDSNFWVVTRESAREYPNLYYSNDLKTFHPFTNRQPQNKYNWFTSELITWPLGSGKYSQGILYKPENFDSTKKYPVIFNYYEIRSEELNEFIQPEFSRDNINIPWFVSRGYLVFVPDIHFEKDKLPMECSLNAMETAADYLSKYSWVDSNRLGLQGHSFGGQQTAFIITHSHRFAAASESAGVVEEISDYGGILGWGASRQSTMEIGQHRMGGSIWEKPEAYIHNSAIFYATHVTTPLLMMHNKDDGSVNWRQGLEFFTDLRRLGKRVWMLDYDEEGHGLFREAARIDYNRRLTQFFDHYLKGTPPPAWMINGIPAWKKGKDYGYELDTSGKEPEEQEVLYNGKMQKVR